MSNMASAAASKPSTAASSAATSASSAAAKEQDSQLKSLLQCKYFCLLSACLLHKYVVCHVFVHSLQLLQLQEVTKHICIGFSMCWKELKKSVFEHLFLLYQVLLM